MNKDFQKLYKVLLKVRPEKSDAMVWLQGDRYDRGKKVLEMYNLGFASKIVVSGNNILIGPSTREGENNIGLKDMEKYLINNSVNRSNIIVDDGALNTKEQAIHITKLAKRKKWNKLILVSSAYHQPRVFLSFITASKVIGYKIGIINQSFLIDKNKVASGRVFKNSDLMKQESLKIENYQASGDIASYKEGFDYLEEAKMPILNFRLATIKDADILLEWRNDPLTRKFSKHSGLIAKEDHIRWLVSSLKNLNRKIYIAECHNVPVGIIRTDYLRDVQELSWTVAPAARGQGMGKKMVSTFIKQATCPIRAEVKVNNEASKRIAEYAGMKFDHEENGIIHYKYSVVGNKKI